MVRVTLYRVESGCWSGFEARGHAGAAPKGEDLVCAAVSAVTSTVGLGLERLLGSRLRVTDEEGYLACEFDPDALTHDVSLQAQVLIETLSVGLHEMVRLHGSYVQVKEVRR